MNSAATSVDLRPSARVRNVNTPDGAVLLDINQGLCFSMNPVGARIWDLLKTNHCVDEIADTLASECSVAREQVLEDVRTFLAQLQNQHLLVPTREAKKSKAGVFRRLFYGAHRPK